MQAYNPSVGFAASSPYTGEPIEVRTNLIQYTNTGEPTPQKGEIIMIYDNIKNASKYKTLREDIKTGLEKISGLETLEVGKYEIDGKKIFASVQQYESKITDPIRFENHKNYIDIQYIIDGEEEIITAYADEKLRDAEYNDVKDVEFYKYTPENNKFNMKAGDFLILFPGEAHVPGLAKDGKPQTVKKIVVKIMM